MSRRILVVDDDRDIVASVIFHLNAAGYQACGAFDAKECLEKVAKNTFDMFILDIVMPEMDGIVLACRLRSNQETKDIPIIFLSSLARKEDLDGAYAVLGSNVIMPKPFSGNDLVAAVEQQLRRK